MLNYSFYFPSMVAWFSPKLPDCQSEPKVHLENVRSVSCTLNTSAARPQYSVSLAFMTSQLSVSWGSRFQHSVSDFWVRHHWYVCCVDVYFAPAHQEVMQEQKVVQLYTRVPGTLSGFFLNIGCSGWTSQWKYLPCFYTHNTHDLSQHCMHCNKLLFKYQ